MAQQEDYTRVRVAPNGDVILERTFRSDVPKDKVLAKLNEELEDAKKDRARANKRVTRLENRITAVEAL